jgi:hypothetical protein
MCARVKAVPLVDDTNCVMVSDELWEASCFLFPASLALCVHRRVLLIYIILCFEAELGFKPCHP